MLGDGGHTTIDVPGTTINALDIHNRGDITGAYADAGRTGNGYLRDRNDVFT